MKTMKWYQIQALTLLLAVGIASCSKRDDEPNTNANVKEQLIGRKWQIISEKPDTKADFNGDGVPDDEFRQFAQECELDNYTRYTEDGLAIDYDDGKLCTESAPEKYKWELIDNNTKIKVTKKDEAYTMKIISISETVLVVSRPYTVFGINVNVTVTYKKI